MPVYTDRKGEAGFGVRPDLEATVLAKTVAPK